MGPEALDEPRAGGGRVRWIRDDQIEGRARTGNVIRFVQTVDPGDGIVPHHPRSVLEIERCDVAAQQRNRPTIRLDKMDVRRTSRQRFDSQRSGAGVEIGDPGAVDIPRERGKPGLPHPLRRRTGAPSTGGLDEAAAQFPRDDAKPARQARDPG